MIYDKTHLQNLIESGDPQNAQLALALAVGGTIEIELAIYSNLYDWLVQLEVVEAGLTSLEAKLLAILEVKSLRLKRANTRLIPAFFNGLHNLEDLRIDCGEKIEWLGHWTKLKRLRKLRIDDLPEWPACLESIPNLEILSLSGYRLTKLGVELETLNKLKALEIEEEALESVDADFSEFIHLEKLEICSPRLANLPQGVEKLTNIRTFVLGTFLVEELPTTMTSWKSLEQLRINHNPSWEDEDTFHSSKLKKMPSLKQACFPDMRIFDATSMPLLALEECLQAMPNLEVCYLMGCQQKILPEVVRNMRKLQVISLMDNQLSLIPEWLGELTSLKRLTLTNNKIQKLPDNIFHLPNLQRLELDRNPLSAKEKQRIKKLLPDHVVLSI